MLGNDGMIHQYQPLTISGGNITQKVSGTALKLLGADADVFSLGDATHEGGDLKIYRDGSGNLQLSLDADAASNAIALSVYGGVVAQNHLTVGQAALDTSYALVILGSGRFSGEVRSVGKCITETDFVARYPGTGLAGWANAASLIAGNIPVDDSSAHNVKLQIDDNDIIVAQATGDGVGGIVGKRSIQYGGQCHAKTDAGAADYNPSAITSDYIITVDTTAAARAVTISTEDRDSGTAANPRVFIIKDIAGNAGTNNITVSLETAGNIDGAANFVINGDYNSITLIIDGTNGFVI